MKENPIDLPPRWRDRPPGVADEDRAGALTRDVLVPGVLSVELDDRQMARIERNLKTVRRPHPPLALNLVLVGLVLLVSVASVMGFQAGWFARSTAKEPASSSPPAKREMRKSQRGVTPPIAADGTAALEAPSTPPSGSTGIVGASEAASAESPALSQAATIRGLGPLPSTTVRGGTPGSTTNSRSAGRDVAGIAPARPLAFAEGRYSSQQVSASTLPSRQIPTAPQLEPPAAQPTIVTLTPATLRPAEVAPAAVPGMLAPGAAIIYPQPTRPDGKPIATSEEIRALDSAMALLRGKHDAQAALWVLDDYLHRFPQGMLVREARVARMDALLMLNRSDEALLALETLQLDQHGRSAELQVIRAELRSRTDCPHAEQDFGAVLARTKSAALEERALYGRASCRTQHGDAKGAAQDLRRYLERFPNGSHAAWARQWLESSYH
jgi:hypothetical protein